MFPSYVSFNIISNVNNMLLYQDMDTKLNYSGTLIIPFAQTDVIGTYLSGINETLENEIKKHFVNIMENYICNMYDHLSVEKLEKINEIKNQLTKNFKTHINSLKKDFYSPILESLDFLPREEIGNLAESLIQITSLKRKIDSNLESVGGNIDVALISKGDGFIWKKRNPYFDPKINPKFFDEKMNKNF